MEGLAHDEQVADLAQHPAVGPGAPDVLREVGAVHRATDPPLREEAGGDSAL